MEDSAETKPESKDGKLVELRPVFEIETSAMRFIHTNAQGQQTAVAKRATHTGKVDYLFKDGKQKRH